MELDLTPTQDVPTPGQERDPAAARLDRPDALTTGDGASADAVLQAGAALPASFLTADAAGQGVGAEVLLAQATAARDQIAAEQSVDPGKVDRAVDVITERLTSGFGNPVRHRDLEAVERAVAGLSPNEATRAIGRLSDDQLDKWAVEMHQVGIRGGFSRDEIDGVYSTLAERLDGRQLSRFAGALDAAGREALFSVDHAPFDEGQRFGQIIAREAPVAARVGLVRASAAQEREDSPSVGFAGGEALASLRGAALDGVLRDLGPTGVASAITRAAGYDFQSTSVGASVGAPASAMQTHDLETVGRMVTAIASSNDPRIKAAAFANAAPMVDNYQSGVGLGGSTFVQGRNELQTAVGGLLQSDASGVTRWLANDQDVHSVAMTAYLKTELDAGRDAAVRGYLLDLRGGGGTDVGAWMDTQERGVYQNARNLGYALGATKSAILDQTGDRKDQIESLQNIFGTAVGVGGAAHPVAGVAGTLITGMSNELVQDHIREVESAGRDRGHAIEDLVFPRVADPERPGEQMRYAGEGLESYNSRRNTVLLDRQ